MLRRERTHLQLVVRGSAFISRDVVPNYVPISKTFLSSFSRYLLVLIGTYLLTFSENLDKNSVFIHGEGNANGVGKH